MPAIMLLLLLAFSGCRRDSSHAQPLVLETGDEPAVSYEQSRPEMPVSPEGSARAGEPTAEPEEEPAGLHNYMLYGGIFELPVVGATGFAGTELPLHEAANGESPVLDRLIPGQGFTVLEEYRRWWRVDTGFGTGWVSSAHCLINLPDIVPSIVYNNTNTYSSLFRSSGREIPNVTGATLYQARDFNARLGREEFIMPVLYGMAGRIFSAQQAALTDGNTIIIYEAFRPHDAHQVVYDNFLHLIENDAVVRRGVTSGWLTTTWFLAASPYNHQRGTAVDASLARVHGLETRASGDFGYLYVSDFEEFPMQTAMHELSGTAAVFAGPVHSRSETDWHRASFAENVTEGTMMLQRYMTDQGLTPLASEWWHFNDLPGTAFAIEAEIVGQFSIERSYSRPVVIE
ncbi:MAG: SH3 domain-containing protein [Treponema sp.]|nr:SH3 domain-containing protein [Treponema sp.]